MAKHSLWCDITSCPPRLRTGRKGGEEESCKGGACTRKISAHTRNGCPTHLQDLAPNAKMDGKCQKPSWYACNPSELDRKSGKSFPRSIHNQLSAASQAGYWSRIANKPSKLEKPELGASLRNCVSDVPYRDCGDPAYPNFSPEILLGQIGNDDKN